jgi:PAS domain S-box-containing protein
MERAEPGASRELPIEVLCVGGAVPVAQRLAQSTERIETTAVSTAEDAIRRLDGDGTDCLVCDHGANGVDGLALLQIVRARDPDLPFIFVAAEGSERIASEAISAGATDYSVRPSDATGFDRLVDRVETAVAEYRDDGGSDGRRSRRTLETAPDAVCVATDEGLVFANAAARELFGSGDAVGRTLDSVFGPTAETLRAVGSGSEPSRYASTRATIDTEDSSVPVTATASALDWDGSPGVVIVCRPVEGGPRTAPDGDEQLLGDVSKTAGETTQEEALYEHMTESVCGVDERGKITFLNESMAELLDSERSALVGETVWDVFRDRAGEALETRCREALESRDPVSFEVRSDSLDRDLRIRVYPSETGLTVYVRDVSNRRRVESELRRTAETFETLYQLASDQDRSFEQKRERMLEIGTEYLGVPYGFVTEIDDGTQSIIESTGNHELLQPGESCPIEESYCRKTVGSESGILAVRDAFDAGWDGDVAYERFELGTYVGAKLLVDGELYGTVCFAATEPRDLDFSDSERSFVEVMARWLSYEYDNREYRRRLEAQNDRLERFASIVSHDLRNPLNVAMSHLELLRDEHESEHVDEIGQGLDRMESLIQDILTLTREGGEVGNREELTLSEVARRAWDGVVTGDASLSVAEDRLVSADESRLVRLFENLFRNAVEHVEGGVEVTVGTLPEGFYVEDDGPGIPPDERDRVFDQGYSQNDDGTGLGLSIIREIVRGHGWEIAVTESASGGARFEITGLSSSW